MFTPGKYCNTSSIRLAPRFCQYCGVSTVTVEPALKLVSSKKEVEVIGIFSSSSIDN